MLITTCVYGLLPRSRRRWIAAAFASVFFVSLPANADTVLLGSDYLATIPTTSFVGIGNLQGLPIGPANTDTIVQRQANCTITLSASGSNCTIPIEMVALSLQSTTNPLLLVRESPTLSSKGEMMLTSNGSGTGGTFTSSFFDVFFELSTNGGATWIPQQPGLPLTGGSTWSTIPSGILVTGPVGDQAANFHTGKAAGQFDFYPGSIIEEHPEGASAAMHSAMVATPEPGTWLLVATALGLLTLTRRGRLYAWRFAQIAKWVRPLKTRVCKVTAPRISSSEGSVAL